MDNGKWTEYIGKQIKVVYNDGQQTRSREGILENVADGLLFLKQPLPYPKLIVGLGSVIRIEVIG